MIYFLNVLTNNKEKTRKSNMVCPVCAVGGISFILSRILGFPEVVVAFVTGMLATSMAYWVNNILEKKMEKKKRSTCSNQYSFRNCTLVFSQIV
jgi:predicted transporter